MSLIYYYLICFMLSIFLSVTAIAESSFQFPCSPEISPFLSTTEHKITRMIDLNQQHRMAIDYHGDDITMVESGSLIILDNQFMIISLQFSKDFDYDFHNTHIPDEILLVNQDPNIIDDTNPPLWRVVMYPDKDDPYSFHYIGSWNSTIHCIKFYGNYTNSEGEMLDCFSLHVDP